MTVNYNPGTPSVGPRTDEITRWSDLDDTLGDIDIRLTNQAADDAALDGRVTVAEAELAEIDTWAGRVVDMVTAAGQLSRMVFVPAFNCEDIHAELGTGLHPAFRVGGIELPGFWVGMYQGIISGGELISRPNVDPTVSTNFDTFSAAARACGAGWHLMTNAEWAAIALWALKQGYAERGNTNWGRAYQDHSEVGYRGDVEYAPGDATGHGRTLTGSGPNTWRVPNAPWGIADLVGNVWEWVAGFRTDDSGDGVDDIQIIGDNNAATADLSAGSVDWMSLGLEYSSPADLNHAAFNDTQIANLDDGTPIAGADLELMRRLGLMPLSDLRSSVGRTYRTAVGGERLPIRGGSWSHSSNAGWFACHLGSVRGSTNHGIGARPALVVL